jgi:drug/metabolite transporter (DMT)-like permease
MADSPLNSRLRVLGAALLFSTGGAAIKATALTALQLAGLRAAVAALVLFVALPATRRLRDRRVLVVGALYAVMTVAYATANKLTTAGNVMFLLAAAPLVVLVLGRLFLGESASRRDLVFLLPMLTGLGLCLASPQPAQATAPNPALGNAFAVLNLVSWAALLVLMRALGRGRRAVDSLAPAAIAVGNLMAAVVCLSLAGPLGGIVARDWVIVVLLGALQIAFAYILLLPALESVPAFEISLLLLAEPVFNPLWAWAVHGELPTLWAGLGGAIILTTLALKIWWVDRRRERAIRRLERIAE